MNKLTLKWINHDIETDTANFPQTDGKYNIELVDENQEIIKTIIGSFELVKIGNKVKILLIKKNGQKLIYKEFNYKKNLITHERSKLSDVVTKFLLNNCPDMQKVFDIKEFLTGDKVVELEEADEDFDNGKKGNGSSGGGGRGGGNGGGGRGNGSGGKKEKDINFFALERFAGRNFPVKGFIQGKKTQFMINTGVFFLLNHKSSLIILRNLTDDSNQLKDRIEYYSKKLRSVLEANNLDPNLFKVECVDENKITTKSLSSKEPKIMVCLCNKTALGKINEKITNEEKGNFVVFIDESDLLHKTVDEADKEEENAAYELDKLVKSAFCSFSVSGTILDSILKKNIKIEDLIVLDRPAGYTSHNNFLFEDIPDDSKFSTRVEDDILENDKNLLPFLREFRRKKVYRCGNDYHPNYCLMRVSKTIKPMAKLFDHLVSGEFKGIAKMLYVGDYIKLHDASLEHIPSIKLSNGKQSVNKDGVHIFPKGATPSYILEYLKNNGGVKKFPCIITFAGDLCSRGISFGSADWGKCDFPWHLTSMYVTFAKTTDLPEALQISGRLAIVKSDGIPLTLYTTERDFQNIIKGYNLTEEFVSRAMKQTKDTNVKEYISNLNIFKKKIPNRPLTKTEKIIVKKVNSMKEDGGWIADDNGYVLKKVKIDRGNGLEKDKSPLVSSTELLYGEIDLEAEKEEKEKKEKEEKEKVKDDDVERIDGVDLNKLRDWMREDNEFLISRMIKFLYKQNKPITIEEFKTGINYNGKDMISNIFSGRSLKAKYGLVWNVNKDVINLNPKIKNYIKNM